MSDSEIITIMIGFHLGAHKTFKHYYQEIVCGYWKDLFPKTLSYNRFVELQQRSFVVFALFLKEKCLGIHGRDSRIATETKMQSYLLKNLATALGTQEIMSATSHILDMRFLTTVSRMRNS